jgi:chemotaxis methyl-accepting protein methylase
MLTPQQFDRTRRLGIEEAGGLDALLGGAEEGDAAARRRLIGLLTTGFTGFFRHPWHFDVAAEHALWAAHRRGGARLWSAAAATGEEPYSLAMALVEVFRRDDPPVAILATDVDAQALERASSGEYPAAAVEALGGARRDRLSEACNRAAEEFGIERLQKLREASGEQPAAPFADRILEALDEWTARPPGEGHDDDITLLVIRAS